MDLSKIVILTIVNLIIVYYLPNLLNNIPMNFPGDHIQVKDKIVISQLLAIFASIALVNYYAIKNNYVNFNDVAGGLVLTCSITSFRYLKK